MSQSTDEARLARLGYKQEFKRHFTPLEVFGISFSIIGIFPSIACVNAPRPRRHERLSDPPVRRAGPFSSTRCPMGGPLPWSGV